MRRAPDSPCHLQDLVEGRPGLFFGKSLELRYHGDQLNAGEIRCSVWVDVVEHWIFRLVEIRQCLGKLNGTLVLPLNEASLLIPNVNGNCHHQMPPVQPAGVPENEVKGRLVSELRRSSIRVEVGGLTSPANLVLWHTSLVPLAVRRSIPVMAMAGVPLAMAERPMGMLGWARSMIRQIGAHQRSGTVTFVEGRGWVDDRTVSAVAQTLERGFNRLAGVYGSGNAFDLVGWLARNEADWAQSEEWTAWHTWLLSVASGRIELPLSRSSHAVAKRSSMLG
jgi:hypothetical protein